MAILQIFIMHRLGWKTRNRLGGPDQSQDFQKSRQISLSKSSNTDVTKILIGKINKFDHGFDYALFHGDFRKFLLCTGWAGKRGMGWASLITVDIFNLQISFKGF